MAVPQASVPFSLPLTLLLGVLVALTAVLVIPAFAVPLIRPYAFAGAVLFAVLFGWGMPWLATLG